MNLFQRWKQTALHNKALVFTGGIVALGTIFGTGAAIFQVLMMKANNRQEAQQTEKLIQAVQTQADAAIKNAAAAESFARSADGMNTRIMAAEKDFRRMAVDSERSIEATQADAAKALSTSVDANKTDERAWFGIADFEVSQYASGDPLKFLRVRLGLRNSGKTPATEVRAWGIFRVYNSKVDGPSDTDLNSLQDLFNRATGRYVAAPNVNRMLISDDTDGTVSKNYDAIMAKTAFVYYFGQVTYVDIDRQPHVTKFCLQLVDPATKLLASCESGNTMN